MQENSKLINAKELLETTFEKKSRPSLRWLREQTARGDVPNVKIGRLIFYDPEQVRAKWFPGKDAK